MRRGTLDFLSRKIGGVTTETLSANQSSCSARSSRALYSYGSIVPLGKMRSHPVRLGFEGGDYCSFSS